MLKEAVDVRQVPGERRRRWFSDQAMDLMVWTDVRDGIVAFELCYDREKNERAVRWRKGVGFTHERVDDGEGRPGRHKATPVLVPDGIFDAETIARRFEQNSRAIDGYIAGFVLRMLRAYPAPLR